MPFNKQKYLNQEFEARTEEVKLGKDMQAWAIGAEEPSVIVRGLTFVELARVKEIASRNRDVSALITALATNQSKDKVLEIKKIMGLDQEEVPEEAAKSFEMFAIGVIDPVFSIDEAVLFGERHPIEFGQITTVIMKLTGKGQKALEKPQPSGAKKASEQA